MKKIYLVFLVICMLFCCYISYGSVGCMDTSLHAYACNDGKICELRRFDNKVLHYVPCTCPCTTYEVVDRKAKCLRCWHYHDPRYLDLTPNINRLTYATQQMSAVLKKRKRESSL
jgi:hypothetical protein